MILRIEDLKNVCSTILAAVDSNELSRLTETLEFKSEKNILYLNVTNREYYAQVKLQAEEDLKFHATVNANLFLKLIAQTTTDTVELKIVDNVLDIRGNGHYKLPLIYDNEKLLELPEITINNKTVDFDIDSSILTSIVKYNSREITKNVITNPVQKLYYIDEHGCITFSSGACVNNFLLAQPIKLLLNNRLVKLFKLFKNEKVHFTLGYDSISDDLIQTKVKFEDSNVTITSIITEDDTLLNIVPVEAIRNRANTVYDYTVTLNKNILSEAIDRLMLFSFGYGSKEILKPYSKFIFNQDHLIIHDVTDENIERIDYNSDNINGTYETLLDLTELKSALDNCSDNYINISFGNHEALILSKNNIINIIPECHEVSDD